LLFPLAGLAQYPLDPAKTLDQYNYDHWDSKVGLPDNAVIHLIQSHDEYIWFASYGGITRFNGVDFRTYSAFNTPEIVNNSFTYIFEDNEGVIWTATSGNGAVTVADGKIKIYSIKDGLPSNFVEEIVQDKSGRLWIATSDGLTYKEGNKFVNHDVPKLLTRLGLKSIDVDDDNTVWVGSTNEGVYQLKDGQILNYYNESNGLISNNINYVKVERGNEVWVGTDKGLSIIKNDSIIERTPGNGLPNNMVSTSLVGRNGMEWVGTFRGMGRSDSLGNWSYFSENHPLYENDFTSFMQDAEGNIWLGTYRQGLYKLWDGKFFNFSKENSLQPYIVHCILKRDSKSLYIINELGVDLLTPGENKIEPLDLNHDFSDTKLKFGLLDSRGYLWVATQDYLIKYKDGVSVKINTESGLVNNSVRTLYEDANGNIWAGTSNGISVIEPNGQITNYTSKNGLSHDYIMSIKNDSKGNIWIGTRNGLNVYKDNRFVAFYAKDGLAGDFVFKTFEDSDGVLWVCGNAGLTRFKNGIFNKVTTNNGLPSNTLFQVLEDDNGYFWMTTNQKNISVFSVHKDSLNAFIDGEKKGVTATNYTQADGLKATSTTSSSMSYQDHEGKLWFATTNGVEMIDPLNIEVNKKKPPVMIESFIVGNKSYNLDSSITIPSGKNRITITYAALSYIASERIEYKYKLEGYDDEWLNPDKKRETSYTNLPYGSYTFRVKAANSDGIWNEEGASIEFYVKPAFYQTNLFMIGCVIAAVILVWAIYKIRIRTLENAKVELAKTVAERTLEVVKQKEEIEKQKHEIEEQRTQIEIKNKELQKVNVNLEDIVEERTDQLKKAYNELVEVNKELDTFIYRSVHDVRGPIARLQGLSHLISLETNDEKVLKLVDRLNKAADEMNDVFYNLLNIARLKALEVHSTKVGIKDVVSKVIKRMADKEDYLELEFDISDGFELYSDEDILQIIFHHLIENAIKFRKQNRAQVLITCGEVNDEGVFIRVSDNGKGMELAVADKIFDMFYVGQEDVYGLGLGLYAVKTAIKVLKGDVELIENAYNSEATTFELRLPRAFDQVTKSNSIIKSVP